MIIMLHLVKNCFFFNSVISASQFDWKGYVNGLMQYGSAPLQVTDSDKIIVTSSSYFDNLFPLLDNTSDR